MRQGQQHNKNRSRNRGSGGGGGGGGGRRQQNPVNRVFESNGPDVKIRGNASHIAEKYNSLARDALVSGNTVTAENYFQHAEHYLRILAAAQAYNQQQAAQAAPPVRAPEPSENSEANSGAESGEQRPRGGDRRPRREPVAEAASAAPNDTTEQPVIAEPVVVKECAPEPVDAKPEPKVKKANGAAKKRKKVDGESKSAKKEAPGDDAAVDETPEEVPANV